MQADEGAPIKLFYSYSHKDEELRDELAQHLFPLERAGLIEVWHDREMLPGDTSMRRSRRSFGPLTSYWCWSVRASFIPSTVTIPNSRTPSSGMNAARLASYPW